MATEFDWYGDAEVDIATLRAFIADATGGEQHPDGTVHLDGMSITARVGSDTFRFANLADAATTDHNTALMVHVLIAFAQTHGGSGVLLYNGEEAVLQYGEDGIVFASDWEDWTENSEVAPLLAQFTSRVLPQPLL